MMLKGVGEIDWFTVRPDRVEGTWKAQKLLRKWDKLFTDSQPNAQATFEMGDARKPVTFEMFKPKLSDANQTMSFKVRGIGDKNKDSLTGLKNKRLSVASLFIDESPLQCLPNCEGADLIDVFLIGAKLDGADLRDANLTHAVLKSATMADANLTGAYFSNIICPDGSLNNGTSPCTAEQLNLVWFIFGFVRKGGFFLLPRSIGVTGFRLS